MHLGICGVGGRISISIPIVRWGDSYDGRDMHPETTVPGTGSDCAHVVSNFCCGERGLTAFAHKEWGSLTYTDLVKRESVHQAGQEVRSGNPEKNFLAMRILETFVRIKEFMNWRNLKYVNWFYILNFLHDISCSLHKYP